MRLGVGSRLSVFSVALALPLLMPAIPLLAGVPDQASGSPATERFDGPAELPRSYMQTALADTPAPGRVRLVKAGEDLQEAINGAQCGDTLKLEAGASFGGLFSFPAKTCDDQHWIILRTSASDDSLPPEGTRVNPCYAGVASLPGRPDFHCPAVRNVMAKIALDIKKGWGPIQFLNGANHYRFIGLEITRDLPQEVRLRNLVQLREPEGTGHHIVFDRVWIHGTAGDETKAGVHLTGLSSAAVVDSYFSDLGCIAGQGACVDSQDINGGGGDATGSVWKIVDNFLEAAGESIMFGGAPGTTTPTDIEIRRNYLFKPIVWKPGEPGFLATYTGKPYIVKNHFELKNAQRVLFEGNVLENTWGGFTQSGFSILLTPGNQGGHCPSCRVTDITIRYNKVSHVAGAILMATALPKQIKVPSSGGERFSVHDLLVDDIDSQAYKGFGNFLGIVSNAPPLKSVHIDHVTAFPQKALISVVNASDKPKLQDFSITNSVFSAGERQMLGGGGGQTNCALGRDDVNAVIKNCFADMVFTHNLIIGGSGGWPAGNIVVKDASAAGIRDFREGHGGDYRLCRQKGETPACKQASPGLTGTDGKPLGADVDAIEKATAGVR